MSLLRLTQIPPEACEEQGCEQCSCTWTITAHMLWNALSPIKKFLCNSFSVIQDSLELQIPLLFSGKERDLWERTAVNDGTQPLPVAFVISGEGWQAGNPSLAPHSSCFESCTAPPRFKQGLRGELAF